MISLILFVVLHEEVKLINLLNGLELERRQKFIVSEMAGEADDLRDEFEQKKRGLEAELEPLLSELKSDLLNNSSIPGELKKSIHQGTEKMMKLRSRFTRKIDSLAAELEQILTPEQKYILEQYRPCLIPPKGELRVGQSEHPIGIYNMLNRLRKMPEWRYRRSKEGIINRLMERIEQHKPRWVDIDNNKLREELTLTLKRVRNMSDAEFAIQKEELIRKLKGYHSKPELNLEEKIERFLLSPHLINLIKIESEY